MAIIRIKDLLLRTHIGFNSDELVNKQDVLINVKIETVIDKDILTNDDPDRVYDYKAITKKIISYVQDNNFKLLETLTQNVLDLILNDKRVLRARVEVDKPHALRFAKSVSIEIEGIN